MKKFRSPGTTMLKKTISVITSFAVLAMTFAMPLKASAASGDTWEDYAASGYASGDGSEGNPYRIATAEQLACLAKNANAGNGSSGKFFLLTEDLDLSAHQWIPIGDGFTVNHIVTEFDGNFDGGGHTISGLTVGTSSSPAAYPFAGLFGDFCAGSLANLTLESASVYSASSLNTGSLAGSICNFTRPLKNCHASGQVTGLMGCTGGLAGTLFSNMDNCSSSVNVSGDNNSIGGIAGICGATVQNCSAAGSVSGGIRNDTNSETNNSAGGIAGTNTGTISNSYFTGAISFNGDPANNYIGGIVGQNTQQAGAGSGKVTNCYSAPAAVSVTPLGYYGGIVSYQSSGSESCNFWRSDYSNGSVDYSNRMLCTTPESDKMMTALEMKQAAFADTLNANTSGQNGWDVWAADTKTSNGGYPVFVPQNHDASLSALSVGGKPLTGFNPETLDYAMTVDSSVASVTVTPALSAAAYSSVIVNGRNLSDGSAAVNLSFGKNLIWVKVTAQNGMTRLYTVTITRNVSSDAALSGLTFSNGKISPSFDSGTYKYTVNLPWNVGTFTITPTAACSDAKITVDGNTVASGQQSDLFTVFYGSSKTIDVVVTAQDNVTATKYEFTVTRAQQENPTLSGITFSSGTLSPTFDPQRTVYTLTMPTNVPSVTLTPAPTIAGEIVQVNGSSLTDGKATVSLTPGAGQMITVSVNASDGSSNVNNYCLSVTWQRPNWQDPGCVASAFGGGSGSSSDPYLISSAGQLARLAQQVNSGNNFSGVCFRLTGDIDLSGRDWTPVGTDRCGFCGTLDGDGHRITGLTAGTRTDPVVLNYGLFLLIGDSQSQTASGIVRNLSVDTRAFVGNANCGVLAMANFGTIENCSVSGTITSSDIDCDIGGICFINGQVISGSHSSLSVVGNSNVVGGITCQNLGKIKESYFTGDFSGSVSAGGIAGIDMGSVSNCYSTGNLSAQSEVGGIIARCIGGSNCSVVNCYAHGTLNGGDSCTIGGIAGINGGTVTNCYSAASLTGGGFSDSTDETKIGGIAGVNIASIANCYATGSLTSTATSSIGGIVGLNEGPSAITSSYWSLDAVQKSGDTPRPANLMKGVGEGTDSGTQGLSAAAMKSVASPTFVQTLNGGRTTADEALWKFLSGQNSGFPVLNGIGEGCSSDASLSSLQVGSGTLDPQFSKGRTAYAVAVSKDALSLTVTPTANDPWATVTINGQAATSGTPFTASLTPGANTDVKVVVTAQDKTTVTTYTVTAVRPAPAPTIVSVSVSPSSASVIQGRSQKFTAQVITTGNADKTVKWLVTGNNSARTKIDSSGTLTVAEDETAKSLTIKAISQFDQSRSATATAAVLPSKVESESAGISADLSNTTLPSGVTSVSLRITAVPQQDADNTVIGNLLKGSAFHSPFSQLLVYNVELLDQNGNPIEPTGGAVTVRIPVPAGMSGNLHVYRYNQTDKTLTDMNATVQNGYLVFTTTHLSEYAIAQLTGSSNGSPIPNPKTGSGSGTPFLPLVLIGTGSAAGFVVARRKIKCRFKRKTVD